MNIDWSELLRALGLVMVIEGLMPFAAPTRWRSMLLTIAQIEGHSLRIAGALAIAGGLLLLHLL